MRVDKPVSHIIQAASKSFAFITAAVSLLDIKQ